MTDQESHWESQASDSHQIEQELQEAQDIQEPQKSPARLRVETELAELTERLDKLEALFIGYIPNHYTPDVRIWQLPQEQRSLLMRQRATMQDYKQILEKRLTIWQEVN